MPGVILHYIFYLIVLASYAQLKYILNSRAISVPKLMTINLYYLENGKVAHLCC